MTGDSQKQYRLSGIKKAAVLLVSVNQEIAASVYRHLSDEEIDQLTVEIAELGTVPTELMDQVMEDFCCAATCEESIAHGGMDKSRDLLEKGVGHEKAKQVFDRLHHRFQPSPFDFLKRVDPVQLFDFVSGEAPQMIALIFAFLDHEQSAIMLAALPPQMQAEVIIRIVTLDRVDSRAIAAVERSLERKIATVLSNESYGVGGVDAIGEILSRVNSATVKRVLEILKEENEELVLEIKKFTVTFDDIALLDDTAIQIVLDRVSNEDLAIALQNASATVRSRILQNVSSRMKQRIEDDMKMMGTISSRQIEERQRRITDIIRQLESNGVIVIDRESQAAR